MNDQIVCDICFTYFGTINLAHVVSLMSCSSEIPGSHLDKVTDHAEDFFLILLSPSRRMLRQ